MLSPFYKNSKTKHIQKQTKNTEFCKNVKKVLRCERILHVAPW